MARISLKTLCTALILILLVLLLYLSRSPSPMEQVLVLSKADPYKTVAKKMEQKMIEESERNAKKLLKLPNPKEIIKNAKGPLTKYVLCTVSNRISLKYYHKKFNFTKVVYISSIYMKNNVS